MNRESLGDSQFEPCRFRDQGSGKGETILCRSPGPEDSSAKSTMSTFSSFPIINFWRSSKSKHFPIGRNGMAGPFTSRLTSARKISTAMLELIPACGGANQGDFRSEDGLRAPGERSIYFSDPDTNKLQITALGKENWSLISDEEKWQRTEENREKLGRGLSRFDRGIKAQSIRTEPVALEKPIIPTFSLEERDRRWNLLRAGNEHADLHALISLPNEGHWDQFGADTRYITQIGGTQTEVGAVLPARRRSHRSRARRKRNRMVGLGARLGERHPPVAPLLRRAGHRPLERNPRRARRRHRPLRPRARARRRRAVGNLRKDPRRAA